MPLLHPLPPVGEPYKEAWGDTYDFYGNLVKKGSGRSYKGEHYNWSIDNVYNEWLDLIYPFFESIKKSRDNRLPETEVSNAIAVFKRLYGGFGFNSLMRIIASDPHVLKDALNAEYKVWVDNLYNAFLKQFCEENQIHPIEIPPNTMEAMRELFERHAYGGGVVVRDWEQFMQYSVGFETSSGEVYELTAMELYDDWLFGNLTKELAASMVGLQYGLEKLAKKGKKVRFFEKLFFSKRIEHRKRLMGWGLYPDKKDPKKRVNIFDVVRFYPPPPGQPVPNPLI